VRVGLTEGLPKSLNDRLDRNFQYLRLSITDVCNFKCNYCLPDGYQKPTHREAALTVAEIKNLVAGFAELGFFKVRLTGGEPTTRSDILEIIAAVADTPGIRQVALTTNGYRLKSLVKDLRTAGVSLLNVSIDSLDPERFEKITGRAGILSQILSGIDEALTLGFESVKINVVLLGGMNDQDVDTFIDWTKDLLISVRFIELMRTGKNYELFRQRHLSGGEIQHRLRVRGWIPREQGVGAGPAKVYTTASHLGSVGIIAPYSKDFCVSCNRLRVSSLGALRLCLFGDSDFSLRGLLQSPSQK